MRIGKSVDEQQEVYDGKLSIIHVKCLDEVKQLLNYVSNMMLILDFSMLEKHQQQRAVDMISGALFVNGGALKTVIESVCVSIPNRVFLVEETGEEEAV